MGYVDVFDVLSFSASRVLTLLTVGERGRHMGPDSSAKTRCAHQDRERTEQVFA